MSSQPPGQTRADYPFFATIPTRWMDNDNYGHVNNGVYYSLFDTTINQYLLGVGGLDIAAGPVLAFAAETHCQFLRSLSFPDVAEVGLRVGKLGNSSVRWELGVFKAREADVAAFGYFVHVFVDRATHKPTPMPAPMREALARLQS